MIRRLASRTRRRLRPPEFAGNYDGLIDGDLHGWAWRPREPDAHVEVEQWVDGQLKARTVADGLREDLREAGIGDGTYAWRMPAALDPDKEGPQSIELRIRDGDQLRNGAFELTYEAPPPPPEPEPEPEPEPVVEPEPLTTPAAWGLCDGRDGAVVHGWAWRPVAPEEHVVVEQWVDGVLVAEAVADMLRADLEAAGMGDGRYGWSMELVLAADKSEPQKVELKMRGAGLVANGAFDLTPEETLLEAPAQDDGEPLSNVIGCCDGLKGAALFGWAWDPTRPEEPVEVELWIGGVCLERAAADGFRPDLRSNHVGTGRYGWRLPLDLRRYGPEPVEVEVRVKDGAPLDGGVLTLKNDLALDDPVNAELRPFVEAVLNPDAKSWASQAADAKLTILAYCPSRTEAGKYWAREYDDYHGAMRAFLPALSKLGEVVVLEGLSEADEICGERRAEGRDCVMFAFGPPRRAPLEAPCPVIPAFAWSYPSIPTGSWDGDPRSDWRNVLRFTGRAVVFSRFAAQAVKAAMGEAYPVAFVSPPVRPELASTDAPAWRRTIRLNGVIFDSRDHVFDPEKSIMPTRVWSGADTFEGGQEIEIEGLLVTSVLELADKRRNCEDLVSAFVAANRDRPDATLLLKFSDPDADWMPELYKWLATHPPFVCRVLAVRGPLEGEAYDAMVAASHWYATACTAEGLCLALQDFLAAGRPAIAPLHTALEDHLDADNALLVASDEEDWRWPMEAEDGGYAWTQHPDDVGPTTRRRISWPSLVGALDEAYRLVAVAPEDYARRAASAARPAAEAAAAATALAGLLAPAPAQVSGPSPSKLIRELAAG